MFEPGFFASAPVHVALVVGGVVAVISGVVGVLTVVRGQSFAGHALADIGTTGGAGAFLVGVNPLWGFLLVGVVGAGVMEAFGIRRARGRDVATGIVLGAALGISALFLYFDANSSSVSGATVTVLFGSMFAISASIVPVVIVLCALALLVVLVLYRQLLLCAVSSDMATAAGVGVRSVGVLYLFALSVAVSLSCLTIGAILSTALLIGPAASALRFTKRPGVAMVLASSIGLCSVWLGVLLAYDSYYWPPLRHGWPASFFVVALVFVAYLGSGTGRAITSRRYRRAQQQSDLARVASEVGELSELVH